MTDDKDWDLIDDDDSERTESEEAYNTRESVLEAAMPVLAEFFHIVRCANHAKADRNAAYEAACEAWDRLEQAYVREVASFEKRVMLTDGDAPEPEPKHQPHVHPGSRAIN